MPTDNTTPADGEARAWLDEITQAIKRERDFRKEGKRVVELYEAEKKGEYQFNILFSNTETLAPALYNSTPRPIVQRRFKDADPLGALASKASQRILEFLIDDGMSNYATFDDLMRSATLEALLPGRGITRFKYDAKITKVPGPAAEEGEPASEESSESASYEKVEGETVCGEEIPWDRFLHGYAKKWKDVPWVAFEDFMEKQELIDNFGETVAATVELTSYSESSATEDSAKSGRTEGMGNVHGATVYQIWDKATRKVYFVSPNKPDNFLKAPVDDPLGLTGFFPCPKPLTLIPKITTLTPVPLYAMYEEQAKELNRVTVRINKLIAALKIRGLYDSTISDIGQLLGSEENTLLPADNVAAMYAQGNSLDKSIWLFPIKDIIPVLQQLYLQRQQVKQVIYEITGIADIMRGSSQASETLGAQQIKNQWGTLRLKRAQKEVARYARDSLRIMTEIAVNKLSPETLQGMTGLPIPLGAQKQQAAQLAQQVAQTGQQPPPELAAAASGPSWDDLLSLLRDDLQRSFRIDIETNSTIDAEATEDKQDIGDLLNAMAQFLSGIGPLIENGTMPFDAAKAMMLAIVRRFKFGNEVEEQLASMQAPKPKSDPNAQKAQMELQGMQQEQQGKKVEQEHKMQLQQLDMQRKQQEHAMAMQSMLRQAEVDAAQHSAKLAEIKAKMQATVVSAHAKIAAAKQPANSRPKGK
jgi:hypothetical protein